jgi:hypothetical protein
MTKTDVTVRICLVIAPPGNQSVAETFTAGPTKGTRARNERPFVLAEEDDEEEEGRA